MIDRTNNPQGIECRLVLIETQSMRIFTTVGAAGPLLPRESIPANSRFAESLTRSIEGLYGFSTIQLALLPGVRNSDYCAVHEIVGTQRAVSGLSRFTPLDEIASGEFSAEDRATVRRILNGEARELGTFARPGWLDELLIRIGSSQRPGPWPLIRHLNQAKDSCLLSLTDATGRKIWFKAAGEPNTTEYLLTVELARRFPSYLPPMLDTIPEWNAWVTEDVPRMQPAQSKMRESYHDALAALAEIQKQTAGDVGWLHAAGAQDWSCARIALFCEPFFAEAALAMQAQVSTKTQPLTRTELHRLQEELENAVAVFGEAAIPNTLLHGDIGRGNLIFSHHGPVFLDWAQAFVGHPFISAEHLLAELEQVPSISSDDRRALRRGYASEWREFGTTAVTSAMLLAPAVAAFAYALFVWHAQRGMQNPTGIWPMLRSLLRRSRHELQLAFEAV